MDRTWRRLVFSGSFKAHLWGFGTNCIRGDSGFCVIATCKYSGRSGCSELAGCFGAEAGISTGRNCRLIFETRR